MPSRRAGRADFARTLGRTPADTLARMDAAGDDVPTQLPADAHRIARVGVERTAIPVTIDHPLGDGDPVTLQCDVGLHVALPATRRGIHVSRIGHLLAEYTTRRFRSLNAYAAALCEQLLDTQDSDTAQVTVDATYSYVEETESLRKRQSVEHLRLGAEVVTERGVMSTLTTVGFNHLIACPCVQLTLEHSLPAEHSELREALSQSRLPLMTHTQRSRSEVAVSRARGDVGVSKLVSAVDEAVVRCQNTLPRDAELLLVYQAHREPQFLEDALRRLLSTVYLAIREDHPDASIRIAGRSLESIHDFDLSAEIRETVAALDRARTTADA